jgi:hypothetical protein
VILAQLAPEHGWQVKFALDFPGAPSGAIEATIIHALKALAAVGATSVTFGSGASSSFTPGHNLKGTRVKVLSKAYHAIANDLHLINKSEFREKLGAHPDPIYGKFSEASYVTDHHTNILSQSATLLMVSVLAVSAASSASSRTMTTMARSRRLPRRPKQARNSHGGGNHDTVE